MTDPQYAALDANKAGVAKATKPQRARPGGADDKGGRWNNDFKTKPQAVNDQCSTFTGGVPAGTYEQGAH